MYKNKNIITTKPIYIRALLEFNNNNMTETGKNIGVSSTIIKNALKHNEIKTCYELAAKHICEQHKIEIKESILKTFKCTITFDENNELGEEFIFKMLSCLNIEVVGAVNVEFVEVVET